MPPADVEPDPSSERVELSPLSQDPAIGNVLLDEETIRGRIAELGAEIANDYRGRNPLFVGVLKGASVFLTDLVRHIDLPVEIDFISVSSYGSSTRTSGVVRMIQDLDQDITGRDVILVEDIVETGLTLRYLTRSLEARGPASLKVCSFLARSSADVHAVSAEYVGFTIADDAFVIGYGLDLDQRFRNLPYLAVYAGDRK